MKKVPILCLVLLLPVVLFSCKDRIEETYTINEPVYLSYGDLRNSVKTTAGQEIIQPGKIYFKDQYIFVNEYQKGIHVIDNTDPSNPLIVRFIEIPGNVDMAVKGSILYADSYVDLVAIDIADMENIRETSRLTDVFPYWIPACEDGVPEQVDISEGVVVGWNAREQTVEVDLSEDRYQIYPHYRELLFASFDGAKVNAISNGSTSGTGGSMARFTLHVNYLYTVDNSMLRLFNLDNPTLPVKEKELYVGWNIETLFPYENKLFMGSTTGMYIYGIEDPSNPHYISTFWHASSCDPVVVEGNYAYVTLRAGNLCGDNQSQLDVIDISDIRNPVLLKEYPMVEPYGLGIDEAVLFVCDGDAGLKVYDASDPLAIDQHMLAHYPQIHAFDVIPVGEVLIMIGKDGLYQYDYSNPSDISELSVIPIQYLQHQ